MSNFRIRKHMKSVAKGMIEVVLFTIVLAAIHLDPSLRIDLTPR